MPGILEVDELRTDKFPSPYSRTLVVDKGGAGDFTTITAACDYALANGASPTAATNVWTVVVNQGDYVESPTVWAGIHLVGACAPLSQTVRISGMTTHQSGTSGRSIYYRAQTAMLAAVKVVVTHAFNVFFEGCRLVNASQNFNGRTEVMNCTGAAVAYGLCNLYVDNSYLYAQNQWTGGGSTAQMTVIHFDETCTLGVGELRGNHFKTSSGVSGTIKNPTCFWYESTLSGYFQPEACMWVIENANDPANPPVRLRSNSTGIHRGGRMDLRLVPDTDYATNRLVWPVDIIPAPPVSVEPSFASAEYNEVRATVVRASATSGDPLYLRGVPLWFNDKNQLIANTTGAAPASQYDGTAYSPLWRMRGGGVAYPPTWANGPQGTRAAMVGEVRTAWIEVRRRTSFQKIGLDVTTAGVGALVRFLIYADAGNGLEGVLLHDFGTTTADSIKHAEVNTLPGGNPVILDPGLYALAMRCEGAAFTFRTGTGLVPFLPAKQNAAGTNCSRLHTAADYSTFVSVGERDTCPFIVITTA